MRTIEATKRGSASCPPESLTVQVDLRLDGWALTRTLPCQDDPPDCFGQWTLTHLATGASCCVAASRADGRQLLRWWIGRGAELGCDWEMEFNAIQNQQAVQALYREYFVSRELATFFSPEKRRPWLSWIPLDGPDEPESGKVYALTSDGDGDGPSIANGNTWSDSEVKDDV